MNERIKELYTQVCMEQKLPFTVEHNSAVMLDAFANKFAELIVRECVSTLNEMHMCQSVNNQNYPSAWHDAVDNGIETIKEHFGVEE